MCVHHWTNRGLIRGFTCGCTTLHVLKVMFDVYRSQPHGALKGTKVRWDYEGNQAHQVRPPSNFQGFFETLNV